MGMACPLPVIQTKKALKNIEENGSVETMVDNEASMENLLKMAKEMGLESSYEKVEEHKYRVVITKGEGGAVADSTDAASNEKMVIAVSSDKMGEGIDELGDVLMKGFIYTLTEMDLMPTTVLFYNGGAKLTVEDAPTLEDLKTLEEMGVEILTCGTCLNYYNLGDKLAVGEVTNMYTIMERLQGADKLIRP
ncbi:sulfurtransferase-like selenium metabolism protein YedF [Psychrilyobacter piezotolerans]|uniref:Sulfurtransferase-like selenium metabolism protein YedF n=2 Tax=Fusobacteriaceae TaxID=203492 RepID=A0ABX9KJI6_9FUSO|nr:sulfurtransferase-like selenium metabolism protein YedF [Psychrilyobacter piezotolerans]RDE64200.1 sulfurtransferase-like selenium metabolism protein YedF [Psychrilyobacter sp. S5]REI42292.1 sulfurtransferase-like selenium metabolism protein YedF [Psychrilyobacter piezotolerans]